VRFTDKELIIFDLDGTLIDSVPDLASALNHMLETLQRQPFSEALIRTWVGNGAQTLVKRGLSGSSEIDETIDAALFEKALSIFLTYYGQHLSETTHCYANVKESLHKLKTAGYRLAIVTNKPVDFVAPILKALELEALFEAYLGGDSLSRKKPDPLPLVHLTQELNVSIKASLMVGDSKNDILAANRAKMQSVGVTYGYNYNEPITHFKPDAVIDDFSQLLELLVPSE